MREPLNKNGLSTTKNDSTITYFNNDTNNNSSKFLKQTSRKRGSKPKNKELIIEPSSNLNKFNSAVATWMHMDMAKPATEDPEYKAKLNSGNLDSSNSTTLIIKRDRKRAASNQFVTSDQSDFELNQQQKTANYLHNLTAEQLVKLQHQNSLHLKNNIQHLQQLQRQHQQLHQLNQYHQQFKRKYTKNQYSLNHNGSILVPATRTKSVICSMAQLESDFEQHLLSNAPFAVTNKPNQLKRSKPIKIPGISLAHRDYHQPNQSSFTVGSVQLSPNGYFHCFSPTPPHSLSSPTSSNSSMYSLGSCNSPGSSIASSSSYSPNGQSSLSLNRNPAHYSPIDTLLQTVENERIELQQLAMEDESSNSTINSNNSIVSNVLNKKVSKLKSANVSDLDLVAQNDEDEEDTFEKQKLINLKRVEKKNELVSQRLEANKCTNNNSQIINNCIKKQSSGVIRNGQEALLTSDNNLTVDCDIGQKKCIDQYQKNDVELINLQNKQQQLVQTAQQALVTLASTATNLCKSTTQNTTISTTSIKTNQIIEKSNSIQNNSTNSSQIECSIKTDIHTRNNQSNKNGLLMAANMIHSAAEQSSQNQQSAQQDQTTHSLNINLNQPFNYLVSHSGRTIKPTAAAKCYVQRKSRITKAYMRTQNLSSSNAGRQNGINKTKNNSHLKQFERLLEAAQTNNNRNDSNNNSASTDLNVVRNSIITSVGSLNNTNSSNNYNTNNQNPNETQQIQVNYMPVVQRTPTGRIRNSGAKCRKKYGMENKHQWCIQCRWKKVSSFF